MSVVSASSEKASAAAVKRALALIAEATALLGGAPVKVRGGGKKTATEKTKGTNRGLVKLGLQRQAALAVLIAEWEDIDEEVRAETHTVTKTSKAGKETTKEVPRHPKPTYKDVISLFKKGGRELPEVDDEAIEEAWVAAQAKREHELSVASEASEAEAEAEAEPAPVVTPAKKPAKKSTDAPKKPAAAAPAAAAPAAEKPAAAAKPATAKKPAAAAPAPAAPAAKPAAAKSSEKKIAEIENDEGTTCTVFEFKKKNYIRYPTGHCWNAKKDGEDWGFGEWAGMWMGNAIDASVAEPECEEEEDE